jgi:hypothetical protein
MGSARTALHGVQDGGGKRTCALRSIIAVMALLPAVTLLMRLDAVEITSMFHKPL